MLRPLHNPPAMLPSKMYERKAMPPKEYSARLAPFADMSGASQHLLSAGAEKLQVR
jgi:hypothetical protein